MSTRDVHARTRRGRPAPATGSPGRHDRPSAAAPRGGEGLVVGTVPVLARIAGVLLVLAGATGAAALFPTYLVVGDTRLVLADGAGDAVLALLPALVTVAVGGVLAAGRVPKLGLAYAVLVGALAGGQLLIEIYRGQSSTSRPGVEVLAGERVLTSSVETGPGWVLSVASLALLVVTAGVAIIAWGRTVMDDRGALDAVRAVLAGGAVLLGVATVLCLTLPPADVPDDLVTDPVTGLVTVVPREGPQALLERPGLALLGGLLFAGAVVLCSVVAPSLRPRLAAVGGLLALTVVVLSAGLTGMRDAASPGLEWTVTGAGLLLAGLGYALLTLLAWRLRRTPAPGS